MECLVCGVELEHDDTFGNIDYSLNAIGYPRDYYDRKTPQKYGDIYRCTNEECGEYHHVYDNDGELRLGYPC